MKRIAAIGAVIAIWATALVAPGTASAAAPNAITWANCPEGYPTTIQCATVPVPLDYSRPTSETIDITISRAKATGTASERQGVLLVNRGGPGGTGVAYAASVQRRLPDSLKKAYDVIGFDPRGVGLSNPLYCVDPDEFYQAPIPDPIPSSARDLAINTARMAKYAAGCLSNNGPSIRFYNTPNTARDMDMIRAALGEKQINYLGYSYGTYLGAVYATLFPRNARRFILDSNVSPTAVWYEANLNQNVAFDLAFDEFLKWTAAHNSTYNLGSTESAVRTAWYQVRDALKKSPAEGIFGPGEFDNAASGAMYFDGAWPDLAQAVSSFLNDGDSAGLLAHYGPTDLAGENSTAMYTTVECNDAPWPHSLPRWYADAARQYKKYPFLVWSNTWFNMPCAFWPYSPTRSTKVGGAVPQMLLINATGDAATPYEGSLEMLRALRGSRLVTVTENYNHGQYLYEGNECTDAYGSEYLLTGKLPTQNVSCVGNPHPEPAMTARGSAPDQDDRPGPRR